MKISKVLLGLSLLLLTTGLWAQKKNVKLPKQLREASGLYMASPDSLYWINDSGDLPQLYLTDANGDVQDIIALPLLNIDWEDLTHDEDGNIYIGDFGNNNNNRQNLKIYIFHPHRGTLDSIEYAYPDQMAFPPPVADRNFNMEGFFWFRDSLHLFSKNEVGKGNYYTKHYQIAAQPGQQTAYLRDSLYLKNRVVTAAAMSPDRRTAALLTYNYGFFLKIFPFSKVSLYVLEDFSDSRFLRSIVREQKIRICAPTSQYEAIDFWTNEELLIASERAKLGYGPKMKRIRLKRDQSSSSTTQP
ncbi:MAG: hypothetical protein AAGI23_06025 [Bacteroidota bacterium]